MSGPLQHEDRLEAATRARLSRLSTVPIDCSACREKVREQMDALCPQTGAAALPRDMLRVHRSMLAGEIPVVAGDAAVLREALGSGWAGGSDMPNLSAETMRSCYLRDGAGGRLMGMMLLHEGASVTAAIAPGDVPNPDGAQAVVRCGRRYLLHEVEGVPMVMMGAGGRTLCLMGAPTEKMLRLTEGALADR